jgi:hypothetical protein
MVNACGDILPQDELKRTCFHQKWIEPLVTFGAVAVNLEKGVMGMSMTNIRMDAGYGPRGRGAGGAWDLSRHLHDLDRALVRSKPGCSKRAGGTLDHVAASVFLIERSGRVVFLKAPTKTKLQEAGGGGVGSVSHALRDFCCCRIRRRLARRPRPRGPTIRTTPGTAPLKQRPPAKGGL